MEMNTTDLTLVRCIESVAKIFVERHYKIKPNYYHVDQSPLEEEFCRLQYEKDLSDTLSGDFLQLISYNNDQYERIEAIRSRYVLMKMLTVTE